MLRECAAVAIASLCPACSLLLDFSDNAIPHDGSLDTPFSQAECDYKEPNESVTTPAMIALTDTGPAAICPQTPEDHDFYKFTVTNETMLTIEVRYEMTPTGDLDLRLYHGDGTFIVGSTSITGMERIVCPSTIAPPCPTITAGDYIFEVRPAVMGSVNRYTFSLAN